MTAKTGDGRPGAPSAVSNQEIDDEIEPSDGADISKPAALDVGLHIVATPIGHARDVTLRALDVLAGADLVVCEDTRVTAKLLARHGVRARTTAYHEHNAERVRPQLIARLTQGQRLALVSDAGTPLISDPGLKLVRAALDAGIAVTTAPGASAPLAALVLSGLPSDRFLFAGFLPSRSGQRRAALAELGTVKATLIMFEAPQRLSKSLVDMVEILGARHAAVARELTKRFEEVRRGNLADLARHYMEAGAPRGEIVVVIGPPDTTAAAASEADVDRLLDQTMETMSLRDAAEAVARATGLSRRAVYARALDRVNRQREQT